MQNKVIFKYLRRTIQNFKVPFKPPKIAVYLWTRCQNYNLDTSFTQQKVILGDISKKKKIKEAWEKKNLKQYWITPTVAGAWKMSKNKESTKLPGPWPKPCHRTVPPTWCCYCCCNRTNLNWLLDESEIASGWVVIQRKHLFAANKEIAENGFQNPDSLRKGEWVPFV